MKNSHFERRTHWLIRQTTRLTIGLATLVCAPALVLGAPAVQDPQVVAQVVENFLLDQAQQYPGSAVVSVSTARITRQPACDALEPFISGSRVLRSRMSVGVRCFSPQNWTIYVQADVRVEGTFYVASRTLDVNQRIAPDDLIGRDGDILRLPREAIVDADQAIGQIVNQRITQGVIVKRTSLRDPDAIQRGQHVRIVAQGIGFFATSQGQALENGEPGAQIQVRSASGKIVTGVVVDAGTVQIPM